MNSDKPRLILILTSIWLRIWKHHRNYLFVSIAASVLLGYLGNAMVWVSKSIVDQLSYSKSTYVWASLVILLIIQIGTYSLQFLRSFQDRRFNELFSKESESRLLDSINRRELLEKEHPEFQGKLQVWREAVNNYLGMFTASLLLLQYVSSLGFNLWFLISKNWIAALVVLIFSFWKTQLGFQNIDKRFKTIRRIQENFRLLDYYYFLLTNPDPQKEVALFGASNRIKMWWLERKGTDYELKAELQRLTIKPFFGTQLLSAFSITTVTGIICYLILNRELTIGDYIAITMAASLAETTITSMIQEISKLKENSKLISFFEADQQMFEKEQNSSTAIQNFTFDRELTITSLGFSYPNREEPALNGINLTIRKGEKIVILGQNAAGKSTLVKLILGLYKAPENTIYYDGVPQESIDRSTIWSKSSALFQDFVHYNVSLGENVSIGVTERTLSEHEITEMLQFTGLPLHLFPNGLETALGFQTDSSVNLSGGQWQRLGLARAMIRNCELIVLDEPTSALDPNSELDLFERILQYYQKQTVIMISHRVGIAAKADKIIVMDQGRVIESGTHGELIALNGIYEDMWNKQRSWYQMDRKESEVSYG